MASQVSSIFSPAPPFSVSEHPGLRWQDSSGIQTQRNTHVLTLSHSVAYFNKFKVNMRQNLLNTFVLDTNIGWPKIRSQKRIPGHSAKKKWIWSHFWLWSAWKKKNKIKGAWEVDENISNFEVLAFGGKGAMGYQRGGKYGHASGDVMEGFPEERKGQDDQRDCRAERYLWGICSGKDILSYISGTSGPYGHILPLHSHPLSSWPLSPWSWDLHIPLKEGEGEVSRAFQIEAHFPTRSWLHLTVSYCYYFGTVL